MVRKRYPDLEVFDGKYGEDPPDVTGRDVLIVDFSYDRDVLIDLKRKAKSLQVIDHHKSAQEQLSGLDYCLFDMNRSGAGLTWDFLFPDQPRPDLVNYIEDRDIWTWKLPNSKEISAALNCYPKDFATWDALEKRDFATLAEEGKIIRKYEARELDVVKGMAREVTIRGHKVLAANSAFLQSEGGEALAKERPFSVCWNVKKDGRVYFSLRSRVPDGIDVAQIAQTFGGGGHKHAAGFIIPFHEAMELLAPPRLNFVQRIWKKTRAWLVRILDVIDEDT